MVGLGCDTGGKLLKSFSKELYVPEEKVTPADSKCRLQVLRSKEIPCELRCPEVKGKDDIVKDSWPPILRTVLDDLFVIAGWIARTARLKIPGSSLETGVEVFHVPANRNFLALESVGGGQPLEPAAKLEYYCSGVQTTGVINALEMPFSSSGLCRAYLVDQT